MLPRTATALGPGLAKKDAGGEGGVDSSLVWGDLQAQSEDKERRGEGALAKGRKIYEMIGGRALFGWTVAHKSEFSRFLRVRDHQGS